MGIKRLVLGVCTVASLSCATGGSYSKAVEYDRTGQHQKAVSEFTKAIAWDPDHPAPMNGRGIAYMNLGEYEDALRDFDEAIRLDPSYSLAYYNRGILYGAKLEDHARAIEDFDRSIELDSQHAPSYHSRAASYFHMGKPQQACQDWRNACELGFSQGCTSAEELC